MYHNFVYPSVTEALPGLLNELEQEGTKIGSRAGRTQEMTQVGITLLEPLDREILCDFRKPNIAAQIAETMWVLSGRDDIDWLEHYLPRVREFSDDGQKWRAGYGARLRRWEDHGRPAVVDQWRFIVEHLKEEPASRRAVMSIWDPVVDTQPGKDIPCNDWLSFLSRFGSLDLHVAVRSNDVIWGWSGINQFEWSSLLEITAGMVGAKPGSLHFSTTSFHLYDLHFAKAHRIRTQTLGNLDHLAPSPRFDASVVGQNFDRLQNLFDSWFVLEEMIRNGYCPPSAVDAFTEPMLRSWLRMLQWWWSGDRKYLEPLSDSRLEAATWYSLQPKREKVEKPEFAAGVLAGKIIAGDNVIDSNGIRSRFLDELCALHLEKEAAYGGSWKKRGELFSIIPNIARKVDRIQGGETDDETSADTAGDLLVYLAKYRTWLTDQDRPGVTEFSDRASAANDILLGTEEASGLVQKHLPLDRLRDRIVEDAENLFSAVESGTPTVSKKSIVDGLLPYAYAYARTLWEKEQSDEYRGADAD